MEKKLNPILQFLSDIDISKPVVVCCQCGSTFVDQAGVHSLSCGNCGNESVWDADRFTIARQGDVDDLKSNLERIARNGGILRRDWRSAITGAVLDFAHKLQELSLHSGGGGSAIAPDDVARLIAGWEETKMDVEAELQKIQIAP